MWAILQNPREVALTDIDGAAHCIGLDQWLHLVKGLLRARDDARQLPGHDAFWIAAQRGRQIGDLSFCQLLAQRLGFRDSNGRAIHQDARNFGLGIGKNAGRSETNLMQTVAVGDDGKENVEVAQRFQPVDDLGTQGGERARLLDAPIPNPNAMAGL